MKTKVKKAKQTRSKEGSAKKLRQREIAVTDDGTFSKDFHKPNRRVAVMRVNSREEMAVAKLKTLKGKEKQISRGMLTPLKDKYKCLPKPTGADLRFNFKDKDNERLKSDDRRFRPTGESLSDQDYVNIQIKHRSRFKKKKYK